MVYIGTNFFFVWGYFCVLVCVAINPRIVYYFPCVSVGVLIILSLVWVYLCGSDFFSIPHPFLRVMMVCVG